MHYLVGDIGNTSTRICLLDKRFKIIKSVIFDTKNIFTRGYIKKILKKRFYFLVLYPKLIEKLEKILRN